MFSISENFTFNAALSALVGGGLIGGLAASRLRGQKKTLPSATPDLFVTAGVVLGGALIAHVYPAFDFEPPSDDLSFSRVVTAATLVGAGATMGQGCTCGNGIQGLSGLSLTSLVFVMLFMSAGMLTASLFGSSETLGDHVGERHADASIPWSLAAVSVVGIAAQFHTATWAGALVVDLLAGVSFAAALALSTMVWPSKVLGFLDVFGERGWDPALMCVMGGALVVCLPLYQLWGLTAPGEPIRKWTTRPLDMHHVLGGLLFGMGWGLAGLCPGPVLVHCGLMSPKMIAFGAIMFSVRPLVAMVSSWGPRFRSTRDMLDRSTHVRSAGSRKQN